MSDEIIVADWFNKKHLDEDVTGNDIDEAVETIQEALKEHGRPLEVYTSELVACMVYKDKIIVTGYDGENYITYKFKKN